MIDLPSDRRLAVLAADLAHLAFFTLSPGNRIMTWNSAAADLYGYSKAEAVGRSTEFLRFPGESAVPPSADDARSGRIERHRRRNGAEIFVDLRWREIENGRLVCIRDASRERRTQEDLLTSRDAIEAGREELRRLAGRILDAQENERRRIARELHDDFKQRLGALGFKLAVLAKRSRAQGASAQDLDVLAQSVEELGDDLRRISHQLHPAALERLGLAAALEAQAAEIEERGLVVRRSLQPIDELPPDVAIGLYRIAQEALENAVRYSGARSAHLSLVRDRDEARLAVADDGIGFDQEEALAHGGLGLIGMKERARLLDGRLRIASEPGAGTEIEVAVPLGEPAKPPEISSDDGGSLKADRVERRKMIGPYSLSRVLGEGATAVVYLAQEPPPLARQVALKLHRMPLAGRRETLSFKAERQALAKLKHPHVGQIYEARTTEEGDPYLVMEYVPGMPITEYCDRYRLDLTRRIELFLAVCRGAAHVHQKGVLHRDLKPANILVMEQDDQAVPKIVDFGIAKGLDQPLAEGTIWTQGVAGTPVYISPEVILGREADTRSDVYGLGMVLYELLAGVLPVENNEISPARQSVDVPLPSRRLQTRSSLSIEAAANRRLSTSALIRRLRGDLDWIVQKALAPEPDARYAGAAALAEDLGRHLRDEPVTAGPPTLRYRLGRLMRRRRVEMLAAVIVLFALVGGLITTAWQAQRAAHAAERAAQEAETAQQVAGFLEGLFQSASPGVALGDSVTARQILDRGAARLDRALAAGPVKGRLQLKIANIYRELGFYDQARPIAEEALALHQNLFGEEHPETVKSLRALGRIEAGQGESRKAIPLLRRALDVQERAPEQDPLEIAATSEALAFALSELGDSRLEEAVALYRRTSEILLSSFPTEHPEAIRGHSLSAYADFLATDMGSARARFQLALRAADANLDPDHPIVLDLLGQLSKAHYYTENPHEASLILERLIPRIESVLGAEHSHVLDYRLNLARAYLRSGETLRARGEARACLEKAEQGKVTGRRKHLEARATRILGDVANARGEYLNAAALHQRSLEVARTINPTGVISIDPTLGLAETAFGARDFAAAERFAEALLALDVSVGELRSTAFKARRILVEVALGRGDFARAEALGRALLLDLETDLVDEHDLTIAATRWSYGKALAASGDEEAARESWERVLGGLPEHSYSVPAEVLRAVSLLRLGRIEEARPIARKALRASRDPELLKLCERYGIETPPLEEKSSTGTPIAAPAGPALRT